MAKVCSLGRRGGTLTRVRCGASGEPKFNSGDGGVRLHPSATNVVPDGAGGRVSCPAIRGLSGPIARARWRWSNASRVIG